MKVISVICFAFFVTLTSFGQEGVIVKGTVTDSKGPVAGAEVTFTSKKNSDDDRSATSNKKGEYEVGVSPGEYTVIASTTVDGRRRTSARIDPGYWHDVQTITLDIELGYAVFMNESVTIAAGESQTIEQVSKSVDVISAQEMRDRADFSLVESLRIIPGFRVQQLGGFGRTASIKTRGLRNQDTAILIDGIRFRDPSAIAGDASPFLSDITLTSVGEVEVLRGSGSSLYGTNAIGGTVDFQTPTARAGTHGQIGGAFGGLGLSRFRGNISHGFESGKFGIGGGVSQTTYTKGIDGQDNARNTNVQTRVDASPLKKTNLSGRIFYSNAKVRLNSDPDAAGILPVSNTTVITPRVGVNFTPDANDPDSFQRSRFFSGQLSATQIVNSKLFLSGYYQGLTTRRRNDNGTLGPGFQSASISIFDGRIDTANVKATWTQVRQNTFTAAYEFERENFGNEGRTPTGTQSFKTTASQKSNTFYIQDLVSLLKGDLQISASFRGQWFSLDRPICTGLGCPFTFNNISSPPRSFTADGSVSYYVDKTGTKFRVHIGNGYRIPSLYERFGSYFFLGVFFPLGNPQLKPERSVGVDGGIEQYFAKERVKLSATYFYTEISDEVTYLPTDDFGAPSYYNFDKHFSRGLEFSGHIRPASSTDIFASYTFTNGDIRNFRRPTFPVGNVSSTDRKVYGVPDHQFTLVVTQRFNRLWLNFDFLGTSSYLAQIFSNTTFSTYVYRFTGNRKGDFTAGYTFGLGSEKRTLRLYGTVENVFDQQYFENGFRTVGQTGRVGLTFGF